MNLFLAKISYVYSYFTLESLRHAVFISVNTIFSRMVKKIQSNITAHNSSASVFITQICICILPFIIIQIYIIRINCKSNIIILCAKSSYIGIRRTFCVFIHNLPASIFVHFLYDSDIVECISAFNITITKLFVFQPCSAILFVEVVFTFECNTVRCIRSSCGRLA